MKIKVDAMQPGQIVLLENLRFHAGETKNDPEFAKQLASNADLYVDDAFGTAHRAHASTEGVTHYLYPAVAGLLMEGELHYLTNAINHPKRPLAAIIGGSKISSKLGVIDALLDKVDKLLLGGEMIFTFYKAHGINVGKSIVEIDQLNLAKSLEEKAKQRNVQFWLPLDVVVADRITADAQPKTVDLGDIPDDCLGLDIGPQSIQMFQTALADCKTVFWNGPMGVFEFDQFAKGTEAIAHTLVNLTQQGACTIIGGGDSIAAAQKAGIADQVSHISTGGGASLQLLEGKELPGVAALDDRT